MNTLKIWQWLLLGLMLVTLVCATQGCRGDDDDGLEINPELEYDGNSFKLISLIQQIDIDGENLFIEGGMLQAPNLELVMPYQLDAVLEIMNIQSETSLVLPLPTKPCPEGSDSACQLRLADIRCSVLLEDECLDIYLPDLPDAVIARARAGSVPGINHEGRYANLEIVMENFEGEATGMFKDDTGQPYFFNSSIVR